MNVPFEDWDKTNRSPLIVEDMLPGAKTTTVYELFASLSDSMGDKYGKLGASLGTKYSEHKIQIRVGDKDVDRKTGIIDMDEARKNGIWIYRANKPAEK